MSERTGFGGLPAEERKAIVERYEQMVEANTSFYFEIPAFEKIIEFYEEQEKPGKALEVIEDAMAQHPFSSIFFIRKAELLFDKKKYNEALELLEQAMVYDPTDISIYLLQSSIFTAQKKFKEAVQVLKEPLSTADKYDKMDIYLEMADIYEEWDRYDISFKYLKKAALINPLYPELLDRIWFTVEMTEKYEESIKFHKAFIDRHPYSYLAWHNLGHSYYEVGLIEKAAEAYEYVTLINESYEPAYRDLAESLMYLEKHTQAIEYLNESLALKGEANPRTYVLLGKCYEKLKKYFKAKKLYKKATNLDPRSHKAFYRLGKIYEKEGQLLQAVIFYKKAQEAKTKKAKYWKTLSRIYFLLNDADKGLEAILKAVNLAPAKQKYSIKLAEAYLLCNLQNDALSVVNEAIHQFGESGKLLFLKSAFLFYFGRRKEACATLEQAMDIAPHNYMILDSYLSDWTEDTDILNIIAQHKNI